MPAFAPPAPDDLVTEAEAFVPPAPEDFVPPGPDEFQLDTKALEAAGLSLQARQAGYMQPGTEFLSAVVNDPAGFVKAIPEIATGTVTAPGKLAYRAAADVISKVAGQPEYGGNLAAGMRQGGDVLPVDKFLAEVSKTNPNLATAGKVGQSLSAMAPLAAVAFLPSWAARLVGAGFSAQMIAGAPEQFRQYAEEINKPPEEQDPDKLTTLQSDILQTFAFAPAAGGHAAGGVPQGTFNPALRPLEAVREAFRSVQPESKPGIPPTYRRPGEGPPSYPTAGETPETTPLPAPSSPLSVPPVFIPPPPTAVMSQRDVLAEAAATIEAARLQNKAEVAAAEAEIAAREVAAKQPETIGKPPERGPVPARSTDAPLGAPEPAAGGDRPALRPPATRPAIGADWTASTPVSGDKVSGQWEVLDLGDILTSNHRDYDQALQPRDRSRAASKEQIAKITAGLEPERLGESPTTDNGSPIVDEFNQALTGNGRLAALQIAYGAGTERAGAYKHFVQAQAERLGIDPAKIAGMESPVLVRRVSDYGQLGKPDFARLSNESQVLGMSAAEKAGRDAAMLRDNPGLMDSFLPSEDGDVLAASNRGFLNAFVQGTGDHAELLNADGSHNAKVLGPRVKNAVLGALLGGENRGLLNELVDRASELNVAKAATGVMQAAPRLLKHRGTIYDLGTTLNQALNDLVRIRSAGEKVSEFLGQSNLFADPARTAESDFLLTKLAEGSSARQIADGLARYAAMADKIDLNTGDIFGSAPTPRPELLRKAYEQRDKPAAATQADLPRRKPATPPPETDRPPGAAGEGVSASPEISGGADLPPEPPRGAPPVEDDPHHSVMDAVPLGMQEGVQLVKAFTGTFPRVKELIRALGSRAAGVFRHSDGPKGKGTVELKADIFDVITADEKAELRARADRYAREATDNPREMAGIAEEHYQHHLDELRKQELPRRHSVEALKVIFHEIGHVIDWLPDKLIRGRGNFFGHILALKNFLHRVIPWDPAGHMGGNVTAAEKVNLRAAALSQMQAEVGPMREIVRQIISEEPEWKITGITVDDVKNILGQAAGAATPELTRWFSEQDRAVKVEVLRKAMRGLLDERLGAMGKKEQIGTRTTVKTVRERVGREPTPQEVQKRFGELLAREMRIRNLADLEAVKSELKPAIAWWRGTTEMDPYFNTPSEMYAEAFSMLFNNPAGFAKRAPVTSRLLWNYMSYRPEVGALYDKIQSQIKSGEIYKVRVENLHDMWARDNERSLATGRAQRFTSWRDFYDNVAYHLDRVSGPIFRAARGASNEAVLRQAWGDFNYRAAEHERYFSTNNRDVGSLLVKHNLDWNHDFGEYLYHQRVIAERFSKDGTPLANPLGWDVKDSTARLAEMQAALGPERWAALEEAGRRFYALHQAFVVSPVVEGGMFKPELNQILTDRTHYATFSAVRNLPDNGIERMIEGQYGTAMTPHIYRQIGNLGEIKNPATATMLKGASLISAVARNTMKRELVKALRETETFPGENLKPADMTWTGKMRAPKIVDGPKVGTIVYLDDGKAQAFYVRKLVADSVNGSSPLENQAASVLQRGKGLLKGLFTQQPGFWAFNLVRDTAGFMAQMPGGRAPIGWARVLPRAIVAARASVKGRANPYADAALERRMLISRMEQSGSWAEVADEWEQRVSGYGFDPAAWNKEITATERALKVWHAYMGWGKTIERTNKLAGMIYLDEFAPDKFRNAPEYLKREWVRGLAGSPDFLERGKSASAVDWAFLFYNPWKEGMRSLVRAARTDPVGFTAKASALMLTPTILQTMAYNGAFGDDAKKRYRAVGLYDLTNYLIPHVSSPDQNGAVGFFRLPLFEPHRVLHGVLFQMLTGQSEGMLSHAGGQLPGLNPMITTAYQWASYLMGENPMDFHRSVNLLTDKQQAARGGALGRPGEVFNASALTTMAQQTWNQLGGTMLYRFRNLNLENPPETTAQKIMAAPVLNNIAGRWYKVSATGNQDQARLKAAPVAQQEAQFGLAKDIMIEKIVDKFWPPIAAHLAKRPLTLDEARILREPVDWSKSERALLTDPAFQQFMAMRSAEVNHRLLEIIMSRASPQYRNTEIGKSALQKMTILKSMLQTSPP